MSQIITCDQNGQLRWNGRTHDEIFQAKQAETFTLPQPKAGYWSGTLHERKRQGIWTFTAVLNDDHIPVFDVRFENDLWTGESSIYHPSQLQAPIETYVQRFSSYRSVYAQELVAIETILAHFQKDEDSKKVIPALRAKNISTISILKALRETFGISLREAQDWFYAQQ